MSISHLFSRLKEQEIIIHLVEDNLKITAPEGKLTPPLLAEIKEHKSEIVEFLRKHVQKGERFTTIDPAAESPYYPLSSAQERIFIVHCMMDQDISYNMPAPLELTGTTDRERILSVFRRLIQRHESLRTSFHIEDGQPVQKIHSPEEIEFEIEYYEIGSRHQAAGIGEEKAGIRRQAKERKGDRQESSYQPQHSAPAIGKKDRQKDDLISLSSVTSVAKKAPESANESSPHHSSFMIHNSILKFIRPFDLSKAPLLRVGLVESGDKKILIVDMHHIISDGTSTGILIREFAALYSGAELPPLRLQYKDYAVWQRSDRQKTIKEQEGFWLLQFAGEVPLLNLPTDYHRPPEQDFKGDTLFFEIGKESTKALNTLAKNEDTTLYMVMLAIYNVFLSKICGQEDIVVGTPTAGRRHADLHHIIGMFVNTLALRNYPTGSKTFQEFLEEVKSVTLAAFENQDYPFEELVNKVAAERNTSRNPLFDTMFIFQNMDLSPEVMTALKMRPYKFGSGIAKFELALEIVERGGLLEAKIDYSTALFKRETIERFILYFKEIVSAVSAHPGRELRRVEIITGTEKERMLYGFNDTRVDYPRERTIHELFERQVEKSPESIALVGIQVEEGGSGIKETALTYRELNEESDYLAALLIEKGAAPGGIVGIMMAPGVELAAGLLGILKAGAAYLPIDPGYPAERKYYMLADSGAKLLLVTAGLPAAVDNLEPAEVEKVLIDSPIQKKEAGKLKQSVPHMSYMSYSSYLAYIMYTSGSTGGAKGVMVEHRSVVRLVVNTDYVELSGKTRVLQTGAPVFDATTFETWGPLLNGGQLFLAGKEVILDSRQLGKAIERNKINTLWLTSPLFNQFAGEDIGIFAGLRYLLVGGDVLSPTHINLVRQRHKDLNIINGYGPTENTTFSTTFSINREYSGAIPIGRPIRNSTAFILDKYGNLLPPGIFGELWVGGDGVARGYMNNPGITAEKFITAPAFRGAAHPPSKSHKDRSLPLTLHQSPLTLYRTGDLCRWLPDGNIEFSNRIDQQVKIRGFRVEPGEIEKKLLEHEEISEVMIIDRENKSGEKYLCAYIVKKKAESSQEAQNPGSRENSPGAKDQPGFLEFLSRSLPEYMIPSYFVQMDKLPLTTNGKVDRKSLPEPEGFRFHSPAAYVGPASDVEKQIAAAWSEVLQLEKVGVEDNFFEVGGNSLNIVKINRKLNESLGTKLPVMVFFRYPTIRSFARYIEQEADVQLDRKKRAAAVTRGKVDREQRYRKQKQRRKL